MNIPKRDRWVAGVPRTRNIIFLNKIAHSWFEYGTNLIPTPTKKYDNCQFGIPILANKHTLEEKSNFMGNPTLFAYFFPAIFITIRTFGL